MIIKVPSSQMEVVRRPEWDDKFGGECWCLKPIGIDCYYWVGTKADCKKEHQWFKENEEVL